MIKIFLDAGHGGTDPGAISKGLKEKDWTLDIDNRLASLLKEQGFKIERTRKNDTTIGPNPRTDKIKKSGAKYCISSHINAGGGLGAETIHSVYNNGKLAKEILAELGKVGLNTRRAYTRKNSSGGDYYFMHRLTGSVTTIIVEYGFIDTEEDRDWLSKASNRQKCAEAVVKAICKIEGIKFNNKEVTKENKAVYIVKKGDTLWSISQAYGIKVDELKKANNLKDDLINIGQELVIPSRGMGNPKTAPKKQTKTINQMAKEIIDGKHGNGHENRRKSLGISNVEYQKVRKRVNQLL